MKSLCTIFVILGIQISATDALAASGKVVGQVGMVEGEVLVDNVPVKKTASVREGSVVETKRGKATLIVGKGAVFHLSSESKMVVTEFGATPVAGGGTEEKGSVDLKFGRTRALIMNTGSDKKDLKIRARAATMGVRGTEIFIDAPRDSSRPINFFTLEGRADVKANEAAPPVAVNQNQGVSTHGNNAPAAGGGAATGGGSESPKMAPPTMSVAQVKVEIKNEGMQGGMINTPQDMRRQVTQQYMSDQFGMGALPPLVLDPLQDRLAPVKLVPRFCSAASGTCP